MHNLLYIGDDDDDDDNIEDLFNKKRIAAFPVSWLGAFVNYRPVNREPRE